MDTASSSLLQRPHHRAWLGPAATLGAFKGKWIGKGQKSQTVERIEEKM